MKCALEVQPQRLKECNMTTLTTNHALEETLTKLETALLTPVVAGELKGWPKNVRQSAATFATDWTRYLNTVLHVEYAQIVETDPELSAAVEKMIRTDNQLLDQLAKFHEHLHALEQRAEQLQWQENKLAGERERLEETGISLIVQLKKQRAAAETWLAESLYRDRGVKD
jgi:uncharacterized Ntn-hydrolase superfamily protein